MDVPLVDIGDFVNDKIHIGTKLVNQIIKGLKFKPFDTIDDINCPKNKKQIEKDLQDLYLEDTFVYGDIMYSTEEDKTSHKYILKKGDKKLMSCYETHMDRASVRTLQQKLGDVSTNHVIKNFTDKTYTKLFSAFYKPMKKLLEAYCRHKKLNIPTDICFFYKGGNVFRILLSDITNVFTNQEYKDMMKRSDADFQLYINPNLPNVDSIREEISLIVVYVLYMLKTYMTKGRTVRISNDTKKLKEEYIVELKKAGLTITQLDIETTRAATKEDFMVSLGKIASSDDKEYVLIKKYPSIIEGIDSSKSTYFISRNTSLNFKSKENRSSTFDLIRFRRNFQLSVTLKNGEQHIVGAPFEIIDVSIPKGDDYSLRKMHANINKYVVDYVFDNKLIFKAPSLEYLLEDLHDLLFKQNIFPWEDIKYDKRITRYFLTIIVYEIVERLKNKSDVSESLQNIYNSFKDFTIFIKCLKETPDDCVFENAKNNSGYLKKLYNEYESLYKKISIMENDNNGKNLKQNLKSFGVKLDAIFKKLMVELKLIINNFDKAPTDLILQMYDKLFIKGKTQIL